MRFGRAVGAVAGSWRVRAAGVCLAILPSVGHPQALTSTDRNLETLNLALVMTTSMLGQAFGPSPATLAYTGGFNDVGWNAALGGSFGGQPVALSYVATYDPALLQGSWSVGGTVGATPWTGSASWTFTVLTAATDETDSDIIIPIPPFGFIDRHYRVRDFRFPGGKIDQGETRWTVNGITVRTDIVVLSDWVFPPGDPDRATVSTRIPGEGIAQTGAADFLAGTTSGTIAVSPVPEPATVVLVGGGLLGAGVLVRRRGRAG